MIDFAKERRLSRAGKAAINGFYSVKAFQGGQPVYLDVSGWPTRDDFAEEKPFKQSREGGDKRLLFGKSFSGRSAGIPRRIRMAGMEGFCRRKDV